MTEIYRHMVETAQGLLKASIAVNELITIKSREMYPEETTDETCDTTAEPLSP